MVQDIEVWFSEGLSVGSIQPGAQTCIKDVTFKNVQMHTPIRGIYVKTARAEKGTGLIQNITYENFNIQKPLLWGIYVGPLQDGGKGGKGCLHYPFSKNCVVESKVTVTDIMLKNITVVDGLLPAGILLCNATNPCTGLDFEDVHVHTPLWDIMKQGYFVSNAQGTENDDFPLPF